LQQKAAPETNSKAISRHPETPATPPSSTQAYERALAETPARHDRPWNLVVGYDEFSPGDKLNHDNKRKVMVLSFSFLELGQSCLSSGVFWSTPVAVRSVIIYKVSGGWSSMLAVVLRRLLLGPAGLATAGVPLPLSSGCHLLFARLSNLITDGDGLPATHRSDLSNLIVFGNTVSTGRRSALSFSKLEIACGIYGGLSVFAAGFRLGFSWRGANSHRPCFRHWNVKRKGSDLAWRRPGLCEIDCCDPSQLKVWAAADVHKAVDLVNAAAARHEAGAFPRARLNELIEACGLNPNSRGLLAAMDLRPNRNRLVVRTLN